MHVKFRRFKRIIFIYLPNKRGIIHVVCVVDDGAKCE